MIHTLKPRRRLASGDHRGGFTLVELLVVVVVLAILIGLLLPVITAALRRAREAAVQAEINQLAQALANFKATYGDYPPSRVLLAENGVFPVGTQTHVNNDPNDITIGALAQRSLVALRKFFPKVVFTTAINSPPPTTNTFWYDYNGNGVKDGTYILQGTECLVFFLGGVPIQDPVTGGFGMTGFDKDPVNPFSNSLVSDPNYGGQNNPMYGGNRQPPSYEFNAGRLFLDPNNPVNLPGNPNGVGPPGIPAYYDSFGNSPPGIASTTLNFYVYFSGYGNGVYDANDVNFLSELDANLQGPIGLKYQHGGVIYPSVYPNPYTTSSTITATGTVTYEKPQTFQLFSPGADGLYGVGGQFVAPSSASSSASNALPFDATNTFTGAIGSTNPSATADQTLRIRERDNLTNFQSGSLQ